MDRVAVKLEQDLALMDKGNGEEQVKSRLMDQYGHVMI
jgi:cytochrome c-type biogenesis protein CcmH/NrfF